MASVVKQAGKENDSPATLDINTENDHLMLNNDNVTFHREDRRQEHHHEQGFAPLLQRSATRDDTERLLQDTDSDSDEELASPPIIASKRQRRTCCMVGSESKYCCCFRTRKSCLLVCLVACIVPLASFVIFCSVYFSPVALPHIPVNSSNDHVDAAYTPLPPMASPRLLTFNMFMRPPGVKNNENDYKSERLDYIINHVLPLHDIITVQEAFAYANRRIDQLLMAAFEQGFHYHVASPRHYPWDLAGDGGLLILSRYPIKRADRIEFSRGVHADWLSFKGALHALIQVGSNKDQLVHVYTTHTQASYDNGGKLNLDDTKVRLSQFAHVHQFIQDTAQDDTHPILLMGDLNVDAAVHNGSSPDVPSYDSSLAYTMMMDVLRGKGTDLKLIGGENDDDRLSYTSTWRLDNLTDVPYATFGYHPVTFGDYKKTSNGTLVPAETILTSHNQLLTVQSIDRLLWAGNRSQNHTMTLSDIAVQHFFVDEKNASSYPFTQISDHYGLSAILHATT
ncbi:Endonuclease/Exonuclease/phosphatase [Mucor ambiguus]|uniref:sphingomyelin phosphodiesterase n=1 Tax=Mucor ambiguus TaxID=91626 RepID=A0A0C9MMA4_9FUNG|nr:Endonuclease/Exonuclease/phosphatase [Mucor ambiguus]